MGGNELVKGIGLLRPDTPNLADRAELAINCLTRIVDPALDYEPYFGVMLNNNPPRLTHNLSDFADLCGRFTDALILARQMSGSKSNIEVDEKIRSLLVSCIKEDGSIQLPDRPWTRGYSGIFLTGAISPWLAPYSIKGLVTWYLSTHDEEVRTYLDRMIKGLSEAAVKKEDYWYYPSEVYSPSKGWDSTEEPSPEKTSGGCPMVTVSGYGIRFLVRYIEETGDEKAIELAENLINWAVYHSKGYFAKDGSSFGGGYNPDGTPWFSCFVCATATIAGVLRYGLYAKREDLVEWAKREFDFCVTRASTFGWTPEYAPPIPHGGTYSETCCIHDMIDISIMLAEAGWEEYWNNAERYGRNHLLESQLIDIDQVKKLPPEYRIDMKPPSEESSYTEQDVLERVRGGFGLVRPNDFFTTRAYQGMMGCCHPHGTRALYLLWHHAVTKKEEGVFVNLLFSRDTPWVEVNSHLPYEGKIEIVVHNAPTVLVRTPDWVERTEVQVFKNNEAAKFIWSKSYVKVVGLRPSNRLTVTFPLKRKVEKEFIKDGKNMEYTVEWKGDTVISISPPGDLFPLYQRAHFRSDEAPLREDITYHVPKEEIHW